MKRILHVLAQKPGETGSGIFLQSLILEAAKKNYSQAAIVGVPNDYVDLLTDSLKLEAQNIYPVVFNTEELPFPVVGMSDIMPYNSTRYRDLTPEMFRNWKRAFTHVLHNAIQQCNPDIILAQHLWLLSSHTKSLFPAIPMIAMCHGTGLRQLTLAPQFADQVKEGCQNIDLILALTQYQHDQIIEKYYIESRKILITGSAFNSDIFFPNQYESDCTNTHFVYAGKLCRAKGILSLIKAYRSMNVKPERIKLTVIGSAPQHEQERIMKLADSCDKPLIFTGALSQQELANVFRNAHVFVLPSFYEGLPLVLIEALASGLNVITSDLPGLSQWIGDTINNSGIISYVPLPTMIDVDIPKDTELPDFEANLKNEMENCILNRPFIPRAQKEQIYVSIKEKSWTHLFEKIEKAAQSLCI